MRFIAGMTWLLVVAVMLLPGRVGAQEAPANLTGMTVETWRDDLRFMAGLLTRLHADADHGVPRDTFEAQVRTLSAAIPDLADHEIIVRMASLVALIGDGHTRVNISSGAPGVPSDLSEGFVRLPLRLQYFAEGLFVRSASGDLAPLVGNRVVEIGHLPVEEAIGRVLSVVHGDNDMTRRLLVPRFATMPAVLHATGVVDALGPVRIVTEDTNHNRITREIRALRDADAGTVDVATTSGVDVPWWLQSRGRPYWLEAVPASGTLYVQLNSSRESSEEPMTEFVHRLGGILEASDIQRVVLDLRRNDGGDSELTRPLVALLGGWEAASRDHSLFVLIGRSTFSAAVVLASELERFTKALLVGEPTGGSPNQYGEIETFDLPHSGLTVSYASWFFQTSDPWDARPWVTPDIAVDLTFAAFTAGQDPILDQALSYRTSEPPLAETLLAVARQRGVAAALAEYRRFREHPEHRYVHTERALTELVIDLWRRDAVAASLPVALLVAREYPNSFEAHENVAEIHADLGDGREAVRYAIESLRVHPGNGDALDVLRAVCGEDVVQVFLAQDPATKDGRRALGEACDFQGAL